MQNYIPTYWKGNYGTTYWRHSETHSWHAHASINSEQLIISTETININFTWEKSCVLGSWHGSCFLSVETAKLKMLPADSFPATTTEGCAGHNEIELNQNAQNRARTHTRTNIPSLSRSHTQRRLARKRNTDGPGKHLFNVDSISIVVTKQGGGGRVRVEVEGGSYCLRGRTAVSGWRLSVVPRQNYD